MPAPFFHATPLQPLFLQTPSQERGIINTAVVDEHAKAPRDLVRRLSLPPEFFAIAYRPLSDSNRNSKSNSKGLFSTGFSPRFSTGDQEKGESGPGSVGFKRFG